MTSHVTFNSMYYKTYVVKCISTIANKRRICYRAEMDEGRKRVIGILAAILAARKLAQIEPRGMTPAAICAIDDAIRWAEKIMSEIDRRWPPTSS